MTTKTQPTEVLQQLDGMTKQQIVRLYVELYTKQKLGLYWEHDAIARDKALNADGYLSKFNQADDGKAQSREKAQCTRST